MSDPRNPERPEGPAGREDLRDSRGETVRCRDLDRALRRDLRVDPLGWRGLAGRALSGDADALDRFHLETGLALSGVTEHVAGKDAVRLVDVCVADDIDIEREPNPHRGKRRLAFQALGDLDRSTAIDVVELLSWLASHEGARALFLRGITDPFFREIPVDSPNLDSVKPDLPDLRLRMYASNWVHPVPLEDLRAMAGEIQRRRAQDVRGEAARRADPAIDPSDESEPDRALCDRMLADVSDDDTMQLATQLRIALAKIDRLQARHRTRRPAPARRRGPICKYCGCTLGDVSELKPGSGIYDRLCNERDGDVCERAIEP